MEDRQRVVRNFCADSELTHFWLFFTRIPANPLEHLDLDLDLGACAVETSPAERALDLPE
ncbi:hypothetical protein LA06_00070 [Xanthomonas oryzae pv. oryzae]|nr:hypothetical protein LA06_00070 [Xanthomonas oryzae pv. oryzae]